MKKLLIETFPIRIEKSTLRESVGKNNGRMIVPNMILQRANVPNKNKRIYGKNLLEREGNKLLKNVKEAGNRGILGELDHPESNVVELKNACIGVLDLKWKGNDMLGDVEILNTPSGNILKEILLAGYVPGISSRGMGSVESLMEGDDPEVVEVQDDFEMLCWDAVSDPSTHKAYFREIREGRQVGRVAQKSTSKVDDLLREIFCELGNQCCLK